MRFSWWAVGALAALADAKGTLLETTAVGRCSPGPSISIEDVYLSYDYAQNLIAFNLSLTNNNPNLRALVWVNIDAFGIVAVNKTIDLCSTIAALCPLPLYTFNSSAQLLLGDRVNINLPEITFTIPDFDGKATVRLLNADNPNDELACLVADLTNGTSTRLSSVQWGLAAIFFISLAVWALIAFVNLYWKLRVSSYLPDHRFLEHHERPLGIIIFYQFVVTLGLLGANAPPIVPAWTSNFAWAFGLIYERPIQQGINNMRAATHGDLGRRGGNFLNPPPSFQQAPYTPQEKLVARDILRGTVTYSAQSTSENAVNLARSYLSDRSSTLLGSSSNTSLPADSLTAVSSNSSVSSLAARARNYNPLEPYVAIPSDQAFETARAYMQNGVPRYVTQFNVSPYNAFTTVLVNALFFLCCLLGLFILAIPVVYWVTRAYRRRLANNAPGISPNESSFWYNYARLTVPMIQRFTIATMLPVITMAVYQFRIGESDGTLALAGVAFVVYVLIFLGYVTYSFVLKVSAFQTADEEKRGRYAIGKLGLSHKVEQLPRMNVMSPFWQPFRKHHRWFAGFVLLVTLVRSLVVGAAQSHSLFQCIFMTIFDVAYALLLIVFRPFETLAINIVLILVQLLCMVSSGFMIGFNAHETVQRIPKTVLGFVILGLTSIACVLYLIVLAFDVAGILLYWRWSAAQLRAAQASPETGQSSPPRVVRLLSRQEQLPHKRSGNLSQQSSSSHLPSDSGAPAVPTAAIPASRQPPRPERGSWDSQNKHASPNNRDSWNEVESLTDTPLINSPQSHVM